MIPTFIQELQAFPPDRTGVYLQRTLLYIFCLLLHGAVEAVNTLLTHCILQCALRLHHDSTSCLEVHCIYTASTLLLHCTRLHHLLTAVYSICSPCCKANAVYIQPTLHIHFRYTAGALQFDLGLYQIRDHLGHHFYMVAVAIAPAAIVEE